MSVLIPMAEAERNTADELTAFADGALDAARQSEILAYLSTHPEALTEVAQQMRFRQSIARGIEASTPDVPPELRSHVVSLLEEYPVRISEARQLPSRWKIGIWQTAIAALLLLSVGIGVGALAVSRHSAAFAAPVPAAIVADVTYIHVDCSRAPSLHNLPFPHELGELEGSLKAYLGRPVPYPDLSSIGYEYIGAGPCGKPLEGTAHLLFRSTRPPISDTLSLFVQDYHGQIFIADGKLYWAQGVDSAHPMLVWRRGKIVFYMVGDAPTSVEGAANLMHAQS